MPRSLKKGPYIDPKLIKKVEKIEKVLEIVESIQRDDGMEYGLPTVVKEKLKEITRVLTS